MTRLAELANDEIGTEIDGTEPRPQIILRSAQFRKQREEDWRELERLVTKVERGGIRSLTPHELQRLPLLYRAAVSSLSVARSIVLDRNLLLYLENLALRAFLVVYGPRATLRESIIGFFAREFPRAVRALWPHFLIAFLAMAGGIAAGYFLTTGNEEWFNTLVPDNLAKGRGPMSTREELLVEEIFGQWDGVKHALALFANTLFQHNTMVGILSFSLGLAAGIPTILLMIYNGLIIGAFVAIHQSRGLTTEFVGWLSIHGVTEFTAILLCGAAGLLVADKILFPGRYSRVQSLAIHGRIAATAVLGAVTLFFVAAILEGVFRQLIQSTELRYIIGWTIGLVWLFYFMLAGRRAGHD
jgi:uncharacterized membrane protein SpoIIM required for sporulation